MDDLIKREKVFEHIKAVCLEGDGGALITSEDVLKMAIKDIPSAEKQGEWIPCSERLPEVGVSVIVTSKGGYVYTSNIAHGEWDYGGDVIAWMPLPDPWEGADDE